MRTWYELSSVKIHHVSRRKMNELMSCLSLTLDNKDTRGDLEGKVWFHSLYFKSILLGGFGVGLFAFLDCCFFGIFLLFCFLFLFLVGFFFCEMTYNMDLKNCRQRNFCVFSFLLFYFFDTVSLLTELLQREVTWHSVATEVKSTSATKHVLSIHKSVHFFSQY